MENMEKVRDMNSTFWKNKKVFITGHTGFKGSWLCLWLHSLGAEVTGYALEPPTNPNMFDLCKIDELVYSIKGDVRDYNLLSRSIAQAKPDIIIHMAAQPLVRDSYIKPIETYEINVMGTVNVLEAARHTPNIRAFINITTDKCYENQEWCWGYRENEPLGGYDPYSNSKACSELVTSSYRDSFFNIQDYPIHNMAVATARAGNVIGGGDWAKDRLIADSVNAMLNNEKIKIRNPHAIRPWQHVLEPLSGYLMLAEKLFFEGPEFAEGWNFGPDDKDAKPVEWIVSELCQKWGEGDYCVESGDHPHEATYLKLDCSKAMTRLHWSPRWTLGRALDSIVEWMRVYKDGKDLRAFSFQQIDDYTKTEVE